MTHTPTPWRLSMSGYSIKSNSDEMPIVANNPWGIAMREKDAPQWLENAEFIVRACNAHDGLVAALKAAQGYMRNGVFDLHGRTPKQTAINTLNGGIRAIDAAIAEAEK